MISFLHGQDDGLVAIAQSTPARQGQINSVMWVSVPYIEFLVNSAGHTKSTVLVFTLN